MTTWVHCDAEGIEGHGCHVKMLVDETSPNPGIHVKTSAAEVRQGLIHDYERSLDFCSWSCMAAYAASAARGEPIPEEALA